MSNRLNRLLKNYHRHIEVPWQRGIAGKQKVLFAVYDKQDELKLRLRLTEFELVTTESGRKWKHLDLTRMFPAWMASLKYRNDYFESPQDFGTRLKKFLPYLHEQITTELEAEDCDENTVFALSGIGTLFGLG